MVVRGYHGNGVRPNDPDTMAELTQRSVEVGAARRAARIAAADEVMIGGVKKAAELHVGIVEAGNKILRRTEHMNRDTTKDELDFLKRAQVSAQEVLNRSIGKATQRHEHDVTGQIDLVALVAGEQDVDVFDVDAIEDEDSFDADTDIGVDDDDDDSWDDE